MAAKVIKHSKPQLKSALSVPLGVLFPVSDADINEFISKYWSDGVTETESAEVNGLDALLSGLKSQHKDLFCFITVLCRRGFVTKQFVSGVAFAWWCFERAQRRYKAGVM